jgi:hypothetical protein
LVRAYITSVVATFRERSREQLVRRGPAALTAEVFGLVGRQPVAAVDQDVLPARPR